jgi:hypothetical protein
VAALSHTSVTWLVQELSLCDFLVSLIASACNASSHVWKAIELDAKHV